MLNDAINNENVIGVVLRINSPGGDAMASETMWNAVKSYVGIVLFFCFLCVCVWCVCVCVCVTFFAEKWYVLLGILHLIVRLSVELIVCCYFFTFLLGNWRFKYVQNMTV